MFCDRLLLKNNNCFCGLCLADRDSLPKANSQLHFRFKRSPKLTRMTIRTFPKHKLASSVWSFLLTVHPTSCENDFFMQLTPAKKSTPTLWLDRTTAL